MDTTLPTERLVLFVLPGPFLLQVFVSLVLQEHSPLELAHVIAHHVLRAIIPSFWALQLLVHHAPLENIPQMD